jgi:hypothetical protein
LSYRLFEAPILAWRDRRLPVGDAVRTGGRGFAARGKPIPGRHSA